MHLGSILILIVALAAGDWQCEKRGGLWDCRPPVPVVAPVATPAPSAVVEPAVPLDAPAAAPPLPAEPDAPVAALPALQAARSTPTEPIGTASTQGQNHAVTNPTLGEAWVVQIGAFREQEAAQAAAQALKDGGATILPIEREGEAWYVLLLGAYAAKSDAQRAGDAYAKSGGDYWIRSARSLQKLAKKPS